MALVSRAALFLASRSVWLCSLALGATLLLPVGQTRAADDSDNGSATAKSPAATVDLFDGMKSGDLDVKFFLRNSREAQIVIKNNTDQPLNVQLPDAFAGVPILGQALAPAPAREPEIRGAVTRTKAWEVAVRAAVFARWVADKAAVVAHSTCRRRR